MTLTGRIAAFVFLSSPVGCSIINAFEDYDRLAQAGAAGLVEGPVGAAGGNSPGGEAGTSGAFAGEPGAGGEHEAGRGGAGGLGGFFAGQPAEGGAGQGGAEPTENLGGNGGNDTDVPADGGSETGEAGSEGTFGGAGGHSGAAGVSGSGGGDTPENCVFGSAVYPSGAINSQNSCQSCQPEVSTTMWVVVSDGTPCDGDGVCISGSCEAGCWIGGVYREIGEANSENPCQSCAPSESTEGWSDVPTATCVQAIGTGWDHTCAVVNGAVWCWGNNGSGQLGNNSTESSSMPVPSRGLDAGVQFLGSGVGSHSCARTATSLYCWGANDLGELGDGTTENRYAPAPIEVLGRPFQSVALGAGFTCGVSSGTGEVFCWGTNGSGRLGVASIESSSVPLPLDSPLFGAEWIAAGGTHACAIVDGAVHCWGGNASGQLGNNSAEDSSVPMQVEGLVSGAEAVAAGISHSCALVDGGVSCWGNNFSGQLGNGLTEDSSIPVQVQGAASGVRGIAAGFLHTCALADSGVLCWGGNSAGQLGNDSNESSPLPVPVRDLGADVQQIVSGFEHNCALASGRVRCWGMNSSGQLGDGTVADSRVPAPAVVFE